MPNKVDFGLARNLTPSDPVVCNLQVKQTRDGLAITAVWHEAVAKDAEASRTVCIFAAHYLLNLITQQLGMPAGRRTDG